LARQLLVPVRVWSSIVMTFLYYLLITNVKADVTVIIMVSPSRSFGSTNLVPVGVCSSIIMTKFEREAMTNGVLFMSYHTDNGIYTSKELMKELANKEQDMKFSGVSAQFQNGVAENAIKIVTQKARSMMLHAALHWSGYVDQDLWPMAMSHAAYLHNHMPNPETGVSPTEIFPRTKDDKHQELKNTHPWGCPLYVLNPRLCEGHKLPRWEPWSRRSQYMGASPLHASTGALARNLQTGSIMPQFHVVVDDFFETVHSHGSNLPPNWEELIVLSSFAGQTSTRKAP
jgi:hypothetical protein